MPTHKASNIPNELRELEETLIKTGSTPDEAVEGVYDYIVGKIEELVEAMKSTTKASGATNLRQYFKYHERHRHQVLPETADRLAESLLKLSASLIAYTPSLHSRRYLAKIAGNVIEGLRTTKTEDALERISEFSRDLPKEKVSAYQERKYGATNNAKERISDFLAFLNQKVPDAEIGRA